MDAIGYAFAIGAAPTASMILTSSFIASLDIPEWIEAMLQNFAAGLILGVVGNELFPILTDGVSKEVTEIGVTIGFAAGLLTIHGTEYLADLFGGEEEGEHDEEADGVEMTESAGLWNKNKAFYRNVAVAMGVSKMRGNSRAVPPKIEEDDDDDEEEVEDRIKSEVPFEAGVDEEDIIPSLEEAIEAEIRKSVGYNPQRMDDIVDDSMTDAQRAIHDVKHRRRIESRLGEMLYSVKKVQSLLKVLVSGTAEMKQTGPAIDGNENPVSAGATSDRARKLSVKESEALAERIDEEIHVLQYKLDHSRRLLQGTEFDFELSEDGSLPDWAAHTSLLEPGKKVEMRRKVEVLCVIAEHLVEHVQGSTPIGPYELKEIYMHMDEMHGHLESFHSTIEKFGRRWETRRDSMVMPRKGDSVPMSLVIPVTMDAVTDGLLIGVTVALTRKAGLIVAIANTLEMGTLGMAYSSRISKCTGSTALVRYFTLYMPPVLMLLATGLGAFIANEAMAEPIVHISFVGFGIVALLALVCSELLIEARNAQGEEEKWYIGICIFAGVYLVLMLSPNLDSL